MDEKVDLEETILSFFPTRFGNFKLYVPLTKYNSKYLQTKKEKLGHLIDT